LPTAFWDYVFTSLVIVEVLLALLAFAGLFFFRRDAAQRRPRQSQMLRSIAVLILGVGILTYVARHVDLQRLLHPGGSTTHKAAAQPVKGPRGKHHRSPADHVAFRWDELVVVLGLLVGFGVLAAATRKRLGPPTDRHLAPELLAAALDESLDDLRASPDLRRSIIAAYARMETALAAAGLPRHHAEAPLEYVERALLSLDTSAAAVRRLTDLFLWAKFSHHEPEPSMRDDAVDALNAVRDELRATELTLA
jgi:uncharacterized protein DUF4129